MPPRLASEPRGPAQIRPHSRHLLIILLSVVPDWARGRGMSARRSVVVSTQPPACSPVPTRKSRLPGSPQLRLATPLPAPAIIGRREAGSSKLHPGKCSPMFSPGGRSSEETRPVHPVWAMSPQRLRPPLPFGWTDRTPQRVTSFIGTCTVLWPCSREPCLAALVASVCCQVRTRTLHRGCAGPRARDGDDQAGC